MKMKTVIVFLLGIAFLATFGLSCTLVSSAGELKATGEALATSAAGGREILGTGQAIATQISESGVKETMQAVATDIGESGVKETAQAVATDIMESGVKETAQAMATEILDSGIKETAQAFVTDLPISGEKPEDIPVLGDGVGDLIATSELVSYFSNETFQDVLDFYKREMPLNGWNPIEKDSSVIDDLATLVYEKDGRKASIIITKIPFLGQVTVLITIQNP